MRSEERLIIKKVQNGDDLLDEDVSALVETSSRMKNMRNFESRVKDYEKSRKKPQKTSENG